MVAVPQARHKPHTPRVEQVSHHFVVTLNHAHALSWCPPSVQARRQVHGGHACAHAHTGPTRAILQSSTGCKGLHVPGGWWGVTGVRIYQKFLTGQWLANCLFSHSWRAGLRFRLLGHRSLLAFPSPSCPPAKATCTPVGRGEVGTSQAAQEACHPPHCCPPPTPLPTPQVHPVASSPAPARSPTTAHPMQAPRFAATALP